MKKANKKLQITNNCIIVDFEKYEVLEKLEFIVKKHREEHNFNVMLNLLARYFDCLSNNFDFICKVVEIMPRSYLKRIMFDSEIDWFNAYNNN